MRLSEARHRADRIGRDHTRLVTPDTMFPSTACIVQNALGATGAWGFNFSAACSGFLYGLTVGAHLVAGGAHRYVLVLGADTMSRMIDYTHRSICILFGDGGGAFLLEPSGRCGDRRWLHRAPE